jgi:hypothetical protein
MEAAIQWLPTIGAGIFLTIAITAWFTPDRQLIAVWFGYVGLCSLLLAAALQLHLYVATSILQPRIEFSTPAFQHFRWDRAAGFAPTLKSPNSESLSGQTSPFFSISNASPILAADVSIEWIAPQLDPAQLDAMSPQFSKYVLNLRQNTFDLRTPYPDGGAYTNSYNARERGRINIPFLNRPFETYLPIEVFWRGMVVIVTRLPDRAGNEEFDVEFASTVTWNIPDRGTPQRFVLIAHVRNTKTANDTAIMDADITWSFKR